MSMDIYAPAGSRVIFAYPNAGYPKDRELAAQHLKVGEIYIVSRTDVHRSITYVYLSGFPGLIFNSVNFEDAGIWNKRKLGGE